MFCLIIWGNEHLKVSNSHFGPCLSLWSTFCPHTWSKCLHCCFLPVHSESCHSLSPQKSSRELCCQPKSLPPMLPHVQSLRLASMFPCKPLCTARYHGNLCGLLRLCGHAVRSDVPNPTDDSDTWKIPQDCVDKGPIGLNTSWFAKMLIKCSNLAGGTAVWTPIGLPSNVFPSKLFWRARKSSQHHKTFQINSS